MIEGYPEQASLKDNNTKECPCIDSEDILNQMEDTKCKHFSQKISSGIFIEQGKMNSSSLSNISELELYVIVK